jgi:hypothetical protein
MSSSGMLRRVDLVGTDVLEEGIASIIRVTRIGELGTLAVTSNRSRLRHIPEVGILHSHRRENLESYISSGICTNSSSSFKASILLLIGKLVLCFRAYTC